MGEGGHHVSGVDEVSFKKFSLLRKLYRLGTMEPSPVGEGGHHVSGVDEVSFKKISPLHKLYRLGTVFLC